MILTPGVFGSSIMSASGGFAVPSTLSVLRAFARRAVMSFSDGIFLYPRIFFSVVTGSPAVFCSSSSTFSDVSGSPPGGAGPAAAPAADPPADVVGDGAPSVDGDPARVLGAFTATLSDADATVESEAVEPVRRSAAASRGRAAGALGLCAALIRAASWLSEGMRGAVGRSALGTSGADIGQGDGRRGVVR